MVEMQRLEGDASGGGFVIEGEKDGPCGFGVSAGKSGEFLFETFDADVLATDGFVEEVGVLAHEGPAEIGVVICGAEGCRPDGCHIEMILLRARSGELRRAKSAGPDIKARMTNVRAGVFVFALCSAVTAIGFAQAPAAPAHDPRIPKIIGALSQVKTIRGTALSPDGQHIVWELGGRGGSEIELAPLDHPDSAKRITACASGDRGQESNAVFSPDSKQLAFFSECTSDHKTAVFLADVAGGSAPHRLAAVDGFAKEMQWSPDGKRLSFLYVEGATRPSGALAAEKPQTG